ncbi:MAG: hypothetical protein V7636_2080, partial [Actinomycetota bacterium]
SAELGPRETELMQRPVPTDDNRPAPGRVRKLDLVRLGAHTAGQWPATDDLGAGYEAIGQRCKGVGGELHAAVTLGHRATVVTPFDPAATARVRQCSRVLARER